MLTDREIKTLWRNKAYSSQKMLQCLADLNGGDYNAVRDKCVSLGLVSADECPKKKKGIRGTGLWDDEELEKLVAFQKSGMKYKEIAYRLGRSESGVRHMIKQIGMV